MPTTRRGWVVLVIACLLGVSSIAAFVNYVVLPGLPRTATPAALGTPPPTGTLTPTPSLLKTPINVPSFYASVCAASDYIIAAHLSGHPSASGQGVLIDVRGVNGASAPKFVAYANFYEGGTFVGSVNALESNPNADPLHDATSLRVDVPVANGAVITIDGRVFVDMGIAHIKVVCYLDIPKGALTN